MEAASVWRRVRWACGELMMRLSVHVQRRREGSPTVADCRARRAIGRPLCARNTTAAYGLRTRCKGTPEDARCRSRFAPLATLLSAQCSVLTQSPYCLHCTLVCCGSREPVPCLLGAALCRTSHMAVRLSPTSAAALLAALS